MQRYEGRHKRKNRVIWGWLGSLKTIGNVMFPYSYRAHTNGGAGFPYNTTSPGPKPTSLPSVILIHPAVWHNCSLQTWAENMDAGLCPLFGGAESPSNTMCLGARPTSVPSFILIHPTIWSQYTKSQTDRTDIHGQRSIGETVLQMVAPKSARLVY